MIIENQEQVTEAVLSELERIENPRLKEVLTAAVRHLHELAREVRLTESEMRQACALIAKSGQMTNASHNEVVLLAGTSGFIIPGVSPEQRPRPGGNNGEPVGTVLARTRAGDGERRVDHALADHRYAVVRDCAGQGQ